MSINLQNLFDAKVADFGMQSSHKKFTSDFIRAVNAIAPDLANDLNEDVVSEVEDVSETIDYPTYAKAAIDAGLDYWLICYGNKRSGGEADRRAALEYYTLARQQLRGYLDMVEQRALVDDDDIVGAGQIGLTE
jgi:hypothetical protein